jgi:hypothetical protein
MLADFLPALVLVLVLHLFDLSAIVCRFLSVCAQNINQLCEVDSSVERFIA